MELDFLKGKKRPPGKKRMLNLKVSPEEMSLLRVKAMQFTNGSVSEWIRYAALELLPLVEHIDFRSTADPDLMGLYGESKDEGTWRYDALRKELAAFSRAFDKDRERIQKYRTSEWRKK